MLHGAVHNSCGLQVAAGSGGGTTENPEMLAPVSVRPCRACSMPSFSMTLQIPIDSRQPCELCTLSFAGTQAALL